MSLFPYVGTYQIYSSQTGNAMFIGPGIKVKLIDQRAGYCASGSLHCSGASHASISFDVGGDQLPVTITGTDNRWSTFQILRDVYKIRGLEKYEENGESYLVYEVAYLGQARFG